MFHPDDDPQIYNDLQFKQLMMEFFGVLGQGGVATEQAIDYYPFIDTVFVYFFRAILILTGKTEGLESYLDRNEMYGFLASYFDIELSVHDKCIKFVDTDVFVYEEGSEEVFMAYMDYDETPESPSHPSVMVQEPPSPPKPEPMMKKPQQPSVHQLSPRQSKKNGTNQAKSSYVSSDFVDYTHPTKQFAHIATNQARSVEEVKSTKQVHSSYASHQNVPEDRVRQSPMSSQSKKNGFMPAKIKHSNNKSQEDDSMQQVVIKQVQSSDNNSSPSAEGSKRVEASPVDSAQNISTPNKKASVSYHASSTPPKNMPIKKPGSALEAPAQVPIPQQVVTPVTSQVSRPVENPPNRNLGTGKNPYNLNVSVQFTNSITMKYMTEPYRSNVGSIRQKARHYRDSLRTFFK